MNLLRILSTKQRNSGLRKYQNLLPILALWLFYTVLFGVSRVLGFCAENIMAQGLGQPIIRLKSVTNQWIFEQQKQSIIAH